MGLPFVLSLNFDRRLCRREVMHPLKLIFASAVDASSASEDDLDSEDSEQEIKSCSHCGATSEKLLFVWDLSH